MIKKVCLLLLVTLGALAPTWLRAQAEAMGPVITVSAVQVRAEDTFGVDPENYPGHPEYAEACGVDDFAAGFVRLEGGIILDFRIA